MAKSLKNDSQFAATQLWLATLEKFYTEMPLTRHRRQLRVFNDTFTGKDAADFLFGVLPSIYTNRECTRSTAVSLLQFFINYNYLVNVRNEEDHEFHDNVTLYSFCNEKIERFIKDRDSSFCAKKVRRVSSLKASSINSYKSNNCSNFNSNRFSRMLDTQIANCSILDQTQSGRLSMSCSDLTRLNPESAKPSTSYFVQNTKKNFKILCDSVLKSSENVKNSSIRNMSPLIHRISSRSGKHAKVLASPTTSGIAVPLGSAGNVTPSLSHNLIVNKRLAITDADEFKLWKICLIERFKQAAGISNEQTLLNYDFSGADIRWNCKMVTERGMVLKLPENIDELPVSLIDYLKTLAYWTSKRLSNDSTKNVNVKIVLNNTTNGGRNTSLHQVAYKNHKSPPNENGKQTSAVPVLNERDLFRQMVRALVPFAPLIPGETAKSLVAIFDYMSSRFAEVKRPITTTGLKQVQAQQRFLFTGGQSLRMATRISVPNVSALSPLNSLPPVPPQTRLQRRSSFNDLLTLSILPEGRDKFKSCIRLCLMTLKPSARRRLQILLRYLRRISRNTELQLKEGKEPSENRICILDRISALFIEPGGTISEVKSANFLAFLMDYAQELLFDVPHWLETDVEEKLNNLITGKEYLTLSGGIALSRRSHESVYGRRRLRPSSTPPKLSQTFCDRINTSTFDTQRHEMDENLLKLLDTTIANENLKPTKKAEFIKTFRATYPRIYAIRFPDDVDFDESNAASTAASSKSLISRMRQMLV